MSKLFGGMESATCCTVALWFEQAVKE